MKRLKRARSAINNNIKHSSIKRSFIFFMIFASLLPLAIGSITSYTISRRMIQEEVSNFNIAWIEGQKDYMELLLGNIENIIDNISNIGSLKNVLDKTDPFDDYTSLSTQALIGHILNGYNMDGLVSIDLLSVDGDHYHVGETLNFQKLNSKTSDKLWDMALDSPGSIVWVGLEDNINENSVYQKVITAVRLISKIDSATLKEVPVGLLIFNYSVEDFYEHLSQGSLNKNNTLLIIGQGGFILYHPDKTKIGTKVNKKLLDKLNGDSDTFIESFNGQKLFIVYNSSQKYRWKVLSYTPVEKLTESAEPIILYSLGATVLCLLLIMAYALIFSKRVLVPVTQITQMFKEIKDDKADLDKRLEVNSPDELGELAKWFNAFLQNLSDKKNVEEKLRLANEELEIRVKERTYELENLNAQLNHRTAEIQETLEKLKETQDQLIQREKLAGIGQLSAGIAHEINNPLGYVSSNMSSLKHYIDTFKHLLGMYKQLKENLESCQSDDIHLQIEEISRYEVENSLDYILDDLKDLFLDVNNGLDRVGKIVKSLRMFSWTEKDAVFESTYDLNKGIENSLLIAQNEIKYTADVEQCLGSLPLIEAIGSEINQVLLNIIVNATQAIKMKDNEERGRIKIETWNDERFVYCTIADNGIGINAVDLSHIFNPFFTTKPVGEGTGLGLSISYDIIVNQHHGHISCEGEAGKGAKFFIVLPIKHKKTRLE